jgi:hypothetical protein
MFVFLAIVLLIFGLGLLNGGFNILKKKEYFMLISGKYKWSPKKPMKIIGKKAILHGRQYIVMGAILTIAAISIFVFGILDLLR